MASRSLQADGPRRLTPKLNGSAHRGSDDSREIAAAVPGPMHREVRRSAE